MNVIRRNRERIEKIVAISQMSFRRLAAASVALLLTGFASLPQTNAQSPAPRPEFEVASVKPNTSGTNMVRIMAPPNGGRLTVTNGSLRMLISYAYKVKNFDLSGGPGWMDSERYDVVAKAPDGSHAEDQLQLMTRTLLEDRFKLMVHRETKEMPVYALLPGKNGPKLPEAREGGCATLGPNSPPPPGRGPGQLPPTPCGGFFMGPNRMEGGKISMKQFVDGLSNILGRPVIDKTAFTGTFDVHLEFSPEGTAFAGGLPGMPGGLPPGFDTSGPSIFTAVQDQLGLKLESQKGPAEVLVIDHAEKASEN
jgi:uncharacterized protein (TIGR03435 family)